MMLPWLGNRTFWFCLHTYLSSVGVHVCCACACQGELFLGNCGFLDYHHWRAFSFTSWSPCWFWFLVFKFSINTAIGILPDRNSTDKIYKIIKKTNKQTWKSKCDPIWPNPTRLADWDIYKSGPSCLHFGSGQSSIQNTWPDPLTPLRFIILSLCSFFSFVFLFVIFLSWTWHSVIFYALQATTPEIFTSLSLLPSPPNPCFTSAVKFDHLPKKGK